VCGPAPGEPGGFVVYAGIHRFREEIPAMNHTDLAAALAVRDLTDPTAGPHAMQLVVDAIETALGGAWRIPVRRSPGPRVVPVADNYDRLRYPPDAVTRERRYTHYVGDGRMLRAHTTAHIPSLLSTVDTELLLSVPGICYRRDVIDRQHVGQPHQLDLWRIRPAGPPLGPVDLDQMIGLVVGAVRPGSTWHAVASRHPYTVEGREIDVDGASGPVEIGECGLAHPELLRDAGLPAGASGLAMGLGLDRLVMLAKGIPDIRLLRATDPRIAGQLTDLAPYLPVSAMPPTVRDLSLAVAADLDPELLGDRVRAILGSDADAVEVVEVLAATPCAELPAAARDRMGMSEGQQNLLVRLTLRHPSHTLTAAEANRLRDRVYAGLHAGTRHEWAAQSTPSSTSVSSA